MTTARRFRTMHLVPLATTGAVLALGAAWMGAPAQAGAAPAATGWVRFAQLSPVAPALTVEVDGRPISTNTAYRTVTPYESLAAGAHSVSVVWPGEPAPAAAVRVVVPAGGAVTAAALMMGSTGVELRAFADDLAASPSGQARVRLLEGTPRLASASAALTPPQAATSAAVSGAPAGAATLTAAGPGSVQIPAVPFGSASAYVQVQAGTYHVAVRNPSGMAIVSGNNWPVAAGTVATLAVVQGSTGPTLEVLRDAVGATTMPMGGAQTGFGGMAPRPGSDTAGLVAGAAVLTVGALAGGVLLHRRRTARPAFHSG